MPRGPKGEKRTVDVIGNAVRHADRGVAPSQAIWRRMRRLGASHGHSNADRGCLSQRPVIVLPLCTQAFMTNSSQRLLCLFPRTFLKLFPAAGGTWHLSGGCPN
jgi:hypothetical protein